MYVSWQESLQYNYCLLVSPLQHVQQCRTIVTSYHDVGVVPQGAVVNICKWIIKNIGMAQADVFSIPAESTQWLLGTRTSCALQLVEIFASTIDQDD